MECLQEVQVVVHSMVDHLSITSLHIFLLEFSDRRASIDRLRQASIASSNSDLANSISPPAVRFTTDGAVATTNPFSLVAATRRLSNFE